ncbi:hypothetical protein D3H55_20155 [Bacillus salacetis]|uniref:Uracil-DNA glycosylase-like domain-containing protein n=2 Tax=Bacillus salacetis TaxID=2315464 RepID=A0A3A1QPP1_9BACI|nr:hypothetical protein D3H55_20155 [Bacillus salacetis]
MYYSPHNESVNSEARVIIVGITPGWTQMKTAYEEILNSVEMEKSQSRLLQTAKAAGFSGSIRRNLIGMLDQIGLAECLNIESTLSLFHENRSLLHTTSVIKYPVFIDRQNYTGHKPALSQSNLLSCYAFKIFPEELNQIDPSAIVIPLGRTVESVLLKLKEEHRISQTLLTGFPHPSGANGHRLKQFRQNKHEMTSTIRAWADSE